MFPGQETPSPSCTLYLSARSPIFIRLYLRLESVPLHFLSRSSSSSSSSSSLPHPSSRFSVCTHSPPAVCTSKKEMLLRRQHANIPRFYLQFECRRNHHPWERNHRAYPLCICICICIYIYIYTSILLANGKISSSLLRYEEKSARWNVSFFTPFSQVFFTGMLLWKGGGNYRSEKFFFDSFEGLEIRWFVWKFIRFKDSRVRIHLGWSTGPARSKFKSGGIFLRLFALVWKFIRCKDSRLPNLFRDRNLVRSTFIVILFFFRIVLWRKFTLEEFFRIFNVIYWNWSIFTIIVLLFFLELFCEESLRWRNFFEFLM